MSHPTSNLALIALLLSMLTGCASGAQAVTHLLTMPPRHDPDLDRTGWLTTRTGITFTDHVQLDGDPYLPSLEPTPTFGIGWTWRFHTLDIGAVIEHVPGAHTRTLDGEKLRLGDQAMIAASLRWRFIDQRWGGFYLRGSPGLGVFGTTETLRGAIAQRQALSNPGEVGRAGVGFSYSLETGFFLMLTEQVVLQIDVGVLGLLGSLEVAGQHQSYERYRGLVRAGLEWRL